MSELFSKEIADQWMALVVNCPWTLKNSKDPIKYNRGQGMGTPGSFDIATATDLVLLNMVYSEDYGITKMSSSLFSKVGDDF